VPLCPLLPAPMLLALTTFAYTRSIATHTGITSDLVESETEFTTGGKSVGDGEGQGGERLPQHGKIWENLKFFLHSF